MIIDFKQLAKIEKQYAMNNQQIALNTLQTLIDQAIGRYATGLELDNTVAIETLSELGILKETNKPKPQQLNS